MDSLKQLATEKITDPVQLLPKNSLAFITTLIPKECTSRRILLDPSNTVIYNFSVDNPNSKMDDSKLRIPGFKEGSKMWEKYRGNSELRYNMSQTDTKLVTKQARLQVQETIVKPDSVQPPKSAQTSRMTIQSVRYKSGGLRKPQYLYLHEKYELRRQREYEKDTKKAAEQMEILRRADKLEFKRMHETLLGLCGPEWYQEPSNKQKSFAENLPESLATDRKMLSVGKTLQSLHGMGIFPLPNPKIIWRAIKYADGDAVEFLLGLYKMTNAAQMEPTGETFSINDRIVLSAMTHLALPSTLREMHIRIPSPPPVKKTFTKKPKPEQKKVYKSPYLEPLNFNLPKPKSLKKMDTKTYPNSPYFSYTKELKLLQMNNELPEKSQYKHKDRAPILEAILARITKETADSSTRTSHATNDYDTVTMETTIKQKELPSPSSPSPKKPTSTGKRRRHRHHRKPAKFEFKYYPIQDLDRQPTHVIMGGYTKTRHGEVVPYIQGISKMDYHRRLYRYIYGGIAILPDGSSVRIISGIQYETPVYPCTFLHGGVACTEDGEAIPIIHGVSTKDYPDVPEKEPIPEIVPVKPHCECEALYHEYIKVKETEHQKCLDLYRQFCVTRGKKVIKARPDVTYVVGGIKNTKEGPVYLLSGIRPPIDERYEKIVGGVKASPDGEPTLIISGMQATRLYHEYLESLKQSLKMPKNTALIVGGVSTDQDGTNFLISGVTMQRPPPQKRTYALEGICKDGNVVLVEDDGVPCPLLQPSYSTIISGVEADADAPVHIFDTQQSEHPKFTYVISGVENKPDQPPVLIVSGIKDNMSYIGTPKAQYLIGGVQTQPDGTNILMIQGVVIDRELIPQPCTYVVAGMKPMPDGTTVPIIQAVTSLKPLECECLDLYRKYMEIQEKKHAKCLELYRRYAKKREAEEEEATRQRIKKNTTYIIGGIDARMSMDPKLIIAGSAAEKLIDNFMETPPEMPEPMNPIVGGIVTLKNGTNVQNIQGFTKVGALKKPIVTIGGVQQGSDGKPHYVITGVQAVPSATQSICEHFQKKKYLQKETVMIVGGVKAQPNGTSTFVIEGLTTCNMWYEEPDEDPEEHICQCMRIYNRWLELEMREYDEEIVEGIGRRVDDVVVPFIQDLPELDPLAPKSIEMLPMPKKYYKIACEYQKQLLLLRKVVTSMAEDGFPIAMLPTPWLLPHFRIWMDMRCGKVLDDKDKKNYLIRSRRMWSHFQNCPVRLKKPVLPLSSKEVQSLTWDQFKWCKNKIVPVVREAYRSIQIKFVDHQREFWPSTMAYDFPNKSFLDAFYAYGASCEADVFAYRPWAFHENKNLGHIQDRCRVKPKPVLQK